VAVPVVGAEVLIDDLAHAHTVAAGRGDQHLLGVEALGVETAAQHAGQHERGPGQQRTTNGEMTESTNGVEHVTNRTGVDARRNFP